MKTLPKLGFLYLDHVLRFFDHSNFKGWPDKIDTVVYHWRNDKQRFIDEVRRKKIDVLIGNVPATAYETFREISRELPGVRFLPSLDAQFANKSKENVTALCQKYHIPIPKTEIFYDREAANAYLQDISYPRIIKKSYGPSNYGGYFVHKVDSEQEARQLLDERNYLPVYVQEFVPMAADIRVMLIGHKPVCAFWRRPPEGEWLTNTSQGGSMDYQDVPKQVLDLAVRVSKAANAEYWACDIAVGIDGELRILECATAFAAFPYIRDWIGQYLMAELSGGEMPMPHLPLYNWEELGKIRSSLLRTMRHIQFSRTEVVESSDGAEQFTEFDEQSYPLLTTVPRTEEEWPSEIWNKLALYRNNVVAFPVEGGAAVAPMVIDVPAVVEEQAELLTTEEEQGDSNPLNLSEIHRFFDGVKGIGEKQLALIIDTLGVDGINDALCSDIQRFATVKSIGSKKVDAIAQCWEAYRAAH